MESIPSRLFITPEPTKEELLERLIGFVGDNEQPHKIDLGDGGPKLHYAAHVNSKQ